MSYTPEEAADMLFSALKVVQEHDELGNAWLLEKLGTFLEGFPVESYLYRPSDALAARIKDFKSWCVSKEGEDAGKLMEEIAYLAFCCLKGYNSLKSYQSFSPQLDLTISGSSFDWTVLMKYLHLNDTARTIVIEAKNWDSKVDDNTFSRLCSILQNIFTSTADLGVFITRTGATGFPEDGASTRSRNLSDAQATQIIFHARTNKYVVVLTDKDIEKLTQPGALPRILEAKIRAVEEWTGQPPKFDEDWNEVDLPDHLSKHRR